MPPRPRTKLLGVDTGTVRVGLAVCDETRTVAAPLTTYERKSAAADALFFQRLAETEEAAGFVVGLPVHANGDEGQKAAEARAYGAWLVEVTGLPVAFYDERYTTAAAQRMLVAAGLTHKRRRQHVDRVAASILLQSYLDAGCPDAAGSEDRPPLSRREGED